jgi:hypothetical protein
MPRAGTTWLCQALNAHHDVAAFGESMFWGKSYTVPSINGRYDETALRRAKSSLLAADFESTLVIPGPGLMKCIGCEDLPGIVERSFGNLGSRASPSAVFTSLACEIARAEGKSHWVEKTPHHLLYADRILQHLPEARFVVMIREPYSFMLSYKHYRGHKNTAACKERFARRYHPLACALVWLSSWRAALQLARSVPDQTLIVRMEELEADPVNLILRVQSFFSLPEGVDMQGAVCKVNSAFHQGARPELSDGDIGWMNFIAGAAIREAGYKLLPWPTDVYEVSRSVIDVAAWSLRWLRDMKKTTPGSLRGHLWHWMVR